MTTPLDLDRLQRIHDAMTPGPWREWSQPEPIRCFWRDGLPPGSGSIESTTSMSAFGEAVAATPNLHSQDLLGIIALRNAFPALLAELRKLRAYRERRVAELVVERDAARADAAQARAELDSYLRPSPLCDAYDPDEQPDYLRGLEREVEMRAADLAKPRGGMQVPFHGDFASAPPSTINRLQWWLREIKKQREAERADAARLREALECVAKMECTEHGDDQDGACQSCAALSAARRALDETGKDGAA